MEIHEASQTKSPSIVGQWVRHVVWVTLIAIEMAIGAATPVAVVGAGLAPWNIWAKVGSGIIAPEKLLRYIQNLPWDIAETEQLIRLIEQPWSIAKVQELMNIGKSLLDSVYTREKQRFSDISWGLGNYQKMPWETLVAMMIVLSIYFLLAQSVRLIRLWDRDTWLDSMRKNIARTLGSNNQIISMTDEQLSTELERLLAEQKRRQSNT